MFLLQQLSCKDSIRIPHFLQSPQPREPVLASESQLNWTAPRSVLIIHPFASLATTTHDGQASFIQLVYFGPILWVRVPDQIKPIVIV